MELKSVVSRSVRQEPPSQNCWQAPVPSAPSCWWALMVWIVPLALAVSPSFPDVPTTYAYYAAISDLKLPWHHHRLYERQLRPG